VTAFHRLHPRLQHAIVNDLGWRSLRPVQDLTVDAVLDGHNTVVLAPTAGGKTEASIFPVLSRILTEDIAPVAALYICPIRALLNNQEERLSQYARMVGLDVFKWHGDVAPSKRAAFRRSPAHVLMTTPESLEVMLISSKTNTNELFRNLSMVIVDEVHAFAGDDRGAHLVSVLERLIRSCKRDVQRIGLSATVGNPAEIGRWMQGSSERPFMLVNPPRIAANRDLHVSYVEDLTDAAAPIAALGRGKKSLVFVESRAGAEKVVRALKGRDLEVFIHHSSVSREDRTFAEEQLNSGRNTAIVATSTMELGIDVGDLDHVIQMDAPSSVASFLQRLGRTGRRPGTRPNTTFYCQKPETLLQAVALLGLAERGWVEDVVPADQAMHVLAHQIMALTLQQGGLSRWRVLPWLAQASPFAGLTEDRVQRLVDTMVERAILDESDGLLSLGREGERLYGRKNFFELYAVFSSPPILNVFHGRTEIGHIQTQFIHGFDGNEGPVVFRLAGRAWQVERVEWNRGRVFVKPAEGGKVPSWLGQPHMLSFELCQEMMRLLVTPGQESEWLDRSAQIELDAMREGYDGLLALGTAPVEQTREGVQWHTFAGGAVNRLLAAALDATTGTTWTAGNLSLKAKGISRKEAAEAIAGLDSTDWDAIAISVAARMARGAVSKFQPCLPPDEDARLLVSKLLDVDRTLAFLNDVAVTGVDVASAHRRLDDAPVDRQIVAPLALRLPDDVVRPKNPITIIQTVAFLEEAAAILDRADVIGLDVETTLSDHALCLVQLATRERTFLVDALAIRNLRPLRTILESERIVKVIHYASFERAVLGRHDIELRNVFDTHRRSLEVRGDVLGGHSLASVVARELGVAVNKDEQTGNWASRPLSDAQIAYAAVDAEVLIALYDALQQVPHLRLVASRVTA
jgi:ATP-dependent Lhr-like helicase